MSIVNKDYAPIFSLCMGKATNAGQGLSHLNGFMRACKELGLNYELEGRFLKIEHPYYTGILLGGVADMVPSSVTSMAIKLANDKNAMYSLLSKSGILIPEQKFFLKKDYDIALDFYLKNPDFVVMKPSNGRGGKGITVGISDSAEFKIAWEYCTENITGNGGVLLEERARGFDVRAIMIGDKFSCAVSRVPPYVIGDGKSDIKKLIECKNVERSKHPHHKRFPIDVLKVKLNLDYVPADAEVCFLSNISNIHRGGEAIDITDYINENLQNYLIKIMRAIPGLNVAGIDLMIKDFADINSLRVIEINTSPNYEIHYTPYIGTHRNPAKDFVKSLI